jgi:hypothetical protein
MKNAKVLLVVLSLALAIMSIQACGKSGGLGVGGNVIVTGAGQ